MTRTRGTYAVAAALFYLCGCSDEVEVPREFERIGGEGAMHFVYVHPEALGDKLAQRRAGQAICTKYQNLEYCEVYMWADKSEIPTHLPIRRVLAKMGVYSIKGEKAYLRTLHKDRVAEKAEEYSL